MSELQSGRTARRASLSRLLSFDEQVSTRSKALVSWCRVFATGGLALNVAPELLRVSCASKAKPPSRRRSQREATPSIAAAYSVTLLEVPYDVLAVSVAAMGGTNGGAFDFVIDKSEKLSLRMAARPKRRQKAAAKAVHPLGQFFALAGTVSGDGVSDDSSTAPRSWGEVYDAAEQDGSGSGGGGGGGAGPIGPRYCDVAAGGRLPAYLDVHACAIALRERIFLALRAFDDAVGRVQAAPLVAGAAAAVDSSRRRGHLKVLRYYVSLVPHPLLTSHTHTPLVCTAHSFHLLASLPRSLARAAMRRSTGHSSARATSRGACSPSCNTCSRCCSWNAMMISRTLGSLNSLIYLLRKSRVRLIQRGPPRDRPSRSGKAERGEDVRRRRQRQQQQLPLQVRVGLSCEAASAFDAVPLDRVCLVSRTRSVRRTSAVL